MILHRYLLRFTTFKLVQAMKEAGQTFTLPQLEEWAKQKNVCFESKVTAFTAEDALTQLRAGEGGSLGQPPFVFAIEPLPDDDARERSKGSWDHWTAQTTARELESGSDFQIARQTPYEREDEARCACGAVAVQWRKDTPVCANPECLTKASFGGK